MAEAAFGVELRGSRQAAALSLRQLAARVGYDHSYLSQVERGRRPGSALLAQLCDRALGTGSRLTAAYEHARPRPATAGSATASTALAGVAAGAGAAPGARARAEAPAGGAADAVHSSVTLGSALAATHPSTPPAVQPASSALDRLEATRHALAATIGLKPDGDEWSAIVNAYASDCLVAAPTELLRDLTADVDLLRVSAAGAGTGSAVRLSAPAARLSVVMALTLTSLARHRPAARWWRTAGDAADSSRDVSTRSLVHSWRAVGSERHSPPELLRGSAQALVLQNRGVAAARALAGRSRALAELGRACEARRALDDFHAVVVELPDAARCDLSLFGWAAYKVRWVESWVYTAIGDTAAAYDAQDRALALCPSQHRCERAELELHRAQCLVRDREVAAGLATAMRVLVELPDQWHTEFLYDAAGRVLSAVPAGDLGRSAIRDYRELLLRRPYQRH